MHEIYRKRCRLLPAGVLGVSPNYFYYPPSLGDYRGLDDKLIHDYDIIGTCEKHGI
jgi:hypothetical protein